MKSRDLIIITILFFVIIAVISLCTKKTEIEEIPLKIQIRDAKALAMPVIRKYEGLRFLAYQAGNDYAICYGHQGGIVEGQRATQEQCESWLTEDIDNCSQAVIDLVKVPLTKGQRAALISFTMAGRGRLARSDLLKYLNENNYELAGEELLLWVRADLDGDGIKEKLPGLVARRAEEKALWDL